MLVPVGMYRARAVEAALSCTSPGTEHVHALFEILEGEYEGQFLPWHGFFADDVAKRTVESLRYCGWRGCDLSNLDGVMDDEVTIEVEHWLRDGRSHARVACVHHGSRLTDVVPMAPDRAKAFAERMRGFILGLKHRSARAVEPPPAPPASGSDTQRLRIIRRKDAENASPGDEIVPFTPD